MDHEPPRGDRILHLVSEPAFEPPAVLEERAARLEFAEALGRHALRTAPELFDSLLVGRWTSVEHFVEDFITETGLDERLAELPQPVRPLVRIDRLLVARHLQKHLLVLPIENSVWVFDARAVVKTTVAESVRPAHSEGQDERPTDRT